MLFVISLPKTMIKQCEKCREQLEIQKCGIDEEFQNDRREFKES